MKHLNVLIACEESQAECKAFRELGHAAYSCDMQSCRKSGNPAWHIKGDVTPYLGGRTQFYTQDGKRHRLSRWHLIIAHPPCTYLYKVSAVHLVQDGKINEERKAKLREGRAFFYRCLKANAPFVAVESPLLLRMDKLPPPSCYIDPFWFGVMYAKKSLYWLRNLPPIMGVAVNPDAKCYVTAPRGKYRSRTFPQVAAALAQQWSEYVCKELNINPKK